MYLLATYAPKTDTPDFSMTLLDPVGAITKSSGTMASANTFRFSTKQFEPDIGIGYWGHRWYAPNQNRWLSRDPIADRGFGVAVQRLCDRSADKDSYRFVANRPGEMVDPYGDEIKLEKPKYQIDHREVSGGGRLVSGETYPELEFRAYCEQDPIWRPPRCWRIRDTEFQLKLTVYISTGFTMYRKDDPKKEQVFMRDQEQLDLTWEWERTRVQAFTVWYKAHKDDLTKGGACFMWQRDCITKLVLREGDVRRSLAAEWDKQVMRQHTAADKARWDALLEEGWIFKYPVFQP